MLPTKAIIWQSISTRSLDNRKLHLQFWRGSTETESTNGKITVTQKQVRLLRNTVETAAVQRQSRTDSKPLYGIVIAIVIIFIKSLFHH